MPMKLSLILPVYNVEKYVEQCILSCIHQNIPSTDYEIIAINDGTKDNSLDIITHIAKQYDNITVVSQENAGLSAARNKGLSLAKGDYVWFIDTDDYIQENCLNDIVMKLESNDLDALSISAANVFDAHVERRTHYNDMTVMSGIEALQRNRYNVCAPFTIYRRQFLLRNKLNFMVGVFHEDNEFTPRAYYQLDKVAAFADIVYFVRQNPTSITRSVNPKKSYDCIEVAISLAKFTEKVVTAELRPQFYNLISIVINNSLHNILKSSDKKTLKSFDKYLYDNRIVFTSLKYSPVLKNKIEGFLFGMFPKRVMLIYRTLINLKL